MKCERVALRKPLIRTTITLRGLLSDGMLGNLKHFLYKPPKPFEKNVHCSRKDIQSVEERTPFLKELKI